MPSPSLARQVWASWCILILPSPLTPLHGSLLVLRVGSLALVLGAGMVLGAGSSRRHPLPTNCPHHHNQRHSHDQRLSHVGVGKRSQNMDPCAWRHGRRRAHDEGHPDPLEKKHTWYIAIGIWVGFQSGTPQSRPSGRSTAGRESKIWKSGNRWC